MTTTVYFAGSENESLMQLGGAVVSNLAGSFRTGWQRSSLQSSSPTSGNNGSWWANRLLFSASTFWFSAQTYNSFNNFGSNPFLEFYDANGILRLRLSKTGDPSTWSVYKYDSSSTQTQLGSSFTMVTSAGIIDKFDLFFVGSASIGQVIIYLNGVQQFTFSGNTITESVTNLAQFYLKCENGNGLGGNRNWSELMVISSDTRSAGLQVFPPVANGNTHNFDTGTPQASNVNAVSVTDATFDGSTTAGQIDGYTTGPVVSGTFVVLSYGVSVRSQVGPTGPQHLEIGVRTHGADFFTSPIAQTQGWAPYQNWWPTNPSTSVAWLTNEIGSTPGFNIEVQSAT